MALPGSDYLWAANNQDKMFIIDMLTDKGGMAYLSNSWNYIYTQ